MALLVGLLLQLLTTIISWSLLVRVHVERHVHHVLCMILYVFQLLQALEQLPVVALEANLEQVMVSSFGEAQHLPYLDEFFEQLFRLI